MERKHKPAFWVSLKGGELRIYDFITDELTKDHIQTGDLLQFMANRADKPVEYYDKMIKYFLGTEELLSTTDTDINNYRLHKAMKELNLYIP